MQWVFYDFIADEKVRMIGVEVADLGLHSQQHIATISSRIATISSRSPIGEYCMEPKLFSYKIVMVRL